MRYELNSPPQRASSLAHSMRQLPASNECSHEKHDGPKVLRLDHLHRVITTNGDSRSFDHLVGASEHRCRHLKAERLCGLQIDHQLVSSRRLNWKVRRLLAFEDAIDITGRLTEQVDKIRTVGDQAAGRDH